jgi:hypothetical protein
MQKKLIVSLLMAVFFVGILMFRWDISPVSAAPVIDGVISPGEYDGGMEVQLVGPYPSGAPFSPWTTSAYILWDTQYLYVAVNESVPASTGSGLSSWIEFQFDAGPALNSFVLFSDGTPQHVLYPKPSGPWYWDVPAGFDYPYPWYAATNTATEFRVKYTDYGIAYNDTIKLSIDRGKDDFTNPPLGQCAVWPNPCVFYPTADSSTWGDVTLDHAPPPPPPPPPSKHNVDGVINQSEYDGGMTVQLTGRTNPSWTETAYVDWDSQYLYVAVNESVPATSGHISWIEFAIDAGPSRGQMDAFVLFDDHALSYVTYQKPSGPWTSQGTGNFLAVSNVATEFRIKYTYYGITLGDTIKMSIDRNLGPPPPLPYGFAAFWPQNAIVYDGVPDQANTTTWGDVKLARHNVVITDVTPSKTVVGLGFTINVSITIANSGDYAEILTTTIYANETIVGTFLNASLSSASLMTLTSVWDTTSLSHGTYQMSAVADILSNGTNASESYCNCTILVHVGVPGDITGRTQGVFDGVTNMRDIQYLVNYFNTRPTSSNWVPNTDLNNDGVVNMRDVAIAVANFNRYE